MSGAVAAQIGFIEGTGHLSQRHREFRQIGRHIAHHPIVKSVSQFMRLLNDRTETAQVSRKDAGLLKAVKARIESAARFIGIDPGIKPMLLKHHIDESRDLGIDVN